MGFLDDRRRAKSDEQVERELRMPEDNYDSRHQQQYGSATMWPKYTKEKIAYDTYKAYNDEYEDTREQYSTELGEVRKDYEDRVGSNGRMKAYYETTSAKLLPEHHGRMLPDAMGLDNVAY